MTLIPMPSTRDEWLVLRQRYVGASAVAALFDCQADYQHSHFALWHVKAGLAPEPDVSGPRLSWGLKLEGVIAAAAAEEKGWTVRRGRYAIADDCRLGASLDFEIDHDPTGQFEGPGVMETKNVDWLQHRRKWTDDEPPAHILLQNQAQLAATGYAWGAIPALVGGNDLRIHVYAARPTLIAEIKRRVDAFWQSVADGTPPPADGSDSASHVLAHLYAEPEDDAVDMSANNEWSEAVAELIRAQKARKDADGAYDLAKNRVAALLGNYKRGWGGGFSVSTAITAAKQDRPAREGEIIKGRSETRRYTAKEMAA